MQVIIMTEIEVEQEINISVFTAYVVGKFIYKGKQRPLAIMAFLPLPASSCLSTI